MIFGLCVGLSFFGLQPEQEENLKSNGGKVKLNPLCKPNLIDVPMYLTPTLLGDDLSNGFENLT